MGFFNIIRSVLGFHSRGFNEFEKKILKGVTKELSQLHQAALMRRCQSINLVQRLDGGREINCYVMSGGKPQFKDEWRLSNAAGESLLAKIKITFDGSTFGGCIWLVDGQFFSIEFEQPTEHLESDVGVEVNIANLTETKNQV